MNFGQIAQERRNGVQATFMAGLWRGAAAFQRVLCSVFTLLCGYRCKAGPGTASRGPSPSVIPHMVVGGQAKVSNVMSDTSKCGV
jgi:hypothetical protein